MIHFKHILLFLLCFKGFSLVAFSQQINPFYQNIVSQISNDSVLNSLQKIESLGVKNTPSVALSNAAVWLYGKYSEMGYTNIKRDTFLHSADTIQNLIVTKLGTTHPETILVICGHYDSQTGPGVNDNGSGVSIILEIARLLANIPTEYTIKYIHFTGEEKGYWGSHHYVDAIAVPQTQNIFLVLNIDEVGGVAGMVNNTIMCEKDLSYPSGNNATSAAYTDTLISLVHLYSSLQTEISNAYGSDYVPFQQAGYVVTGLFEKNQSSFVHSVNDSLTNLDTTYVYELTKASVGAALYLAKALNPTQSIELLKKKTEQIKVFPNPFTDNISVTRLIEDKSCIFDMYNNLGLLVLTSKAEELSKKAETIGKLKAGIYFYRIMAHGNIVQCGKICK